MNLMRVRHLFPLVLCSLPLSLPFVAACHASTEDVAAENGGTGEANVGVSAQALSTADVVKVTLTVSGPGISPAIVQDLVKAKGQWTGKLSGIPVGADRTFHADAYDAGATKIYEGEVTGVTIAKGAAVVVALLLQEEIPPDPFANSAPRISSLVASSGKVEQGDEVWLAVAATDPDGDPLSHTWTATGGSFEDATVATPIWTAPASDGARTLSVSVADGKGSQAGMSVTVNVSSTGKADASVSFNTWPVVSQVSADPGQLQPGQSSNLNVTAMDADGDPITYAWSDDCGGAFSSSSAQSPVWTAPATAPPGGACTLAVTAGDGRGGSTSGTLVVGVDLPTVDLPPSIEQSFQSADAVYATEQVGLWVSASDPESTALSFSWSASGGTLGAAVTTGDRSDVLWTAPAASGSFTITARVDDAHGNQTTRSFSVDVTGACGDGIQDYGETGVDCGGPCAPCALASCNEIKQANPAAPDGMYMIDPDGAGGGAPFMAYCDMTTAGGGWTRCYTAPSGSIGYATWQLPGNTCFGAFASNNELLFRGSSTGASYLQVTSGRHDSYANWCRNNPSGGAVALPSAPVAVGLGSQPGSINNWDGAVCMIGGNNDSGLNYFYAWNHQCGGTYTLSAGLTHGNGCDYGGWALGDLWVFWR